MTASRNTIAVTSGGRYSGGGGSRAAPAAIRANELTRLPPSRGTAHHSTTAAGCGRLRRRRWNGQSSQRPAAALKRGVWGSVAPSRGGGTGPSAAGGRVEGATGIYMSSSPPISCRAAAAEARSVLRSLREAAAEGAEGVPVRMRVELPLPPSDMDTDEVLFLGLHGQAADWSGGLQQRFRRTRPYLEEELLDGYNPEFCGMLENAADGVGVWRCDRMTVVTHVSDATVGSFLGLCRGDLGASVLEPGHMLIVVNGFWTEGGGKVGQPWEFGLRREAREVLGRDGDWETVYCLRAVRSADGVNGMLWRRWPQPWRLLDAAGELLLEADVQPTQLQMANVLNEAAGINRSS